MALLRRILSLHWSFKPLKFFHFGETSFPLKQKRQHIILLPGLLFKTKHPTKTPKVSTVKTTPSHAWPETALPCTVHGCHRWYHEYLHSRTETRFTHTLLLASTPPSQMPPYSFHQLRTTLLKSKLKPRPRRFLHTWLHIVLAWILQWSGMKSTEVDFFSSIWFSRPVTMEKKNEMTVLAQQKLSPTNFTMLVKRAGHKGSPAGWK